MEDHLIENLLASNTVMSPHTNTHAPRQLFWIMTSPPYSSV